MSLDPALSAEIRIGAPNMPVLNAFISDRSRQSYIMGPLGSGKTYGTIQKLLLLAQEQAPNEEGVRPSRWAIVRNTYVDLAATTMKDFKEIFIDGEMGYWKLGGIDPPTFHSTLLLPDGTTVKAEYVFMALDKDSDVRKLRGTQFTGAWCNEVKELPKAVLDMLDGRIGRYPTTIAGGVECSWMGIFGDTNAPDDDHWYYRFAEEETPEAWSFFRQPGGLIELPEHDANGKPIFALNPNAEIPPGLPGGIEYYWNQKGGKDDDWIRINLCNRYGFYAEGEPVHPNYIDSLHCLASEPEVADAPIYLGFDWGRTPACAILQWDRATDRKTQIDEFTTWNLGGASVRMSAATFAPELKRYLSSEYKGLPQRGWGDPAGDGGGQADEQTPFTVMAGFGFNVAPAQTNAKLARRMALATPLREVCMDGRPRFQISPKARITRKGLRGGFAYRRIAVAAEKYTNEPDKNMYSHVCEGLEYALLEMGEYHQALSGGQGMAVAGRRRGRRRRKARTAIRWGDK